MPYRYELHCHTLEGSACSVMPAMDLADFYYQAGYSGICVSDHFSGNSTLPDDTLWNDRVDYYYNIYKKISAAGSKLGLSVFFGLEYTLAPDVTHITNGTGNDFLLLNLTKEWLAKSKDVFKLKPREMFSAIRSAGVFVIHAHPFHTGDWVEYIRLLPKSVDAVEVMNAHVDDFVNKNAQFYAQAYNLPGTGGSDLHGAHWDTLSGVETDTPCHTSADLTMAIANRQARPFFISR